MSYIDRQVAARWLMVSQLRLLGRVRQPLHFAHSMSSSITACPIIVSMSMSGLPMSPSHHYVPTERLSSTLTSAYRHIRFPEPRPGGVPPWILARPCTSTSIPFAPTLPTRSLSFGSLPQSLSILPHRHRQMSPDTDRRPLSTTPLVTPEYRHDCSTPLRSPLSLGTNVTSTHSTRKLPPH